MIAVIDYRTPEGAEFFKKLARRAETDYKDIQKKVDGILEDVKENKDKALFEYTRRFDGFTASPENVRVTDEEIKSAAETVSPEFIRIMEKAAARIRDFHERQLRDDIMYTKNGETLGFLIRPLEKVGVYVPGGKAVYPSSVLMNIIPAKVAGVGKIIMVTPVKSDGKVNPSVLAAAKIAGADEIYKIGGAQAVAFPYTTLFRSSEILILADESARADFVAADMLSQAEHDEMASAVLITDSPALAWAVKKEIIKMSAFLPRKDTVEKSLSAYGAIILVENIHDGTELANELAPEHLEICTKDDKKMLLGIKNAGAVFLGNYSPESLGDYMAGTNHVLPTGGSARFFSPLCVDDFIKKMSVISFEKPALEKLSREIELFAESEGLSAHANAVRVRFDREKAE